MKFLIRIVLWSTVMICMAYFVLPSYEGKLDLSIKFGLMWGTVVGIMLFLFFKVIRVITSKDQQS